MVLLVFNFYSISNIIWYFKVPSYNAGLLIRRLKLERSQREVPPCSGLRVQNYHDTDSAQFSRLLLCQGLFINGLDQSHLTTCPQWMKMQVHGCSSIATA